MSWCPRATRVAVLVNPANAASTETTLRDVAAAARAMGLQIQVLNASTSREINAAFATFVRERPDALFVGLDPFLNSRRVQLVNLASRHALPATFSNRDNAEIGGLMSYGANIADAYRQVGVYTGRILKGAKPADLPVVQSTKFELVINAQDRQAARPHRAADAARPRRRGDRMIAGGSSSRCSAARRGVGRSRQGRNRASACDELEYSWTSQSKMRKDRLVSRPSGMGCKTLDGRRAATSNSTLAGPPATLPSCDVTRPSLSA